MKRLLTPSLTLLGLLLPALALGSQPYQALIPAMDIDPALLVPNSESNVSTVTGDTGQATMYDVVGSLGVINSYNAPTMALLSTGNVDNLTTLQDYDYPQHTAFGAGASDDRATLHFQLQVPSYAQSYSFNFYFLSREYPEWVGSDYNDQLEVFVQNPAFSGQIVFDAFGNPVSVNNALFTVTSAAQLTGTGFDADGGTGWVTTVAPCTPGSILDVAFEIYDVADGVWDSAVLIDNFAFSEDDVGGPKTDPDPSDDGPLELAFLSPKEGGLDGGYEVLIHGAGYNNNTTLYVGGVEVEATPQSGGEILKVSDWPGSGSPGAVDIRLERGSDSIVLESGFTYWDEASGSVPPRVTLVLPSEAQPDGGTLIDIRGTGIPLDGSSVWFVVDRKDEDGNFLETVEVEATIESASELADGQTRRRRPG
jgi:hypothetical protein